MSLFTLFSLFEISFIVGSLYEILNAMLQKRTFSALEMPPLTWLNPSQTTWATCEIADWLEGMVGFYDFGDADIFMCKSHLSCVLRHFSGWSCELGGIFKFSCAWSRLLVVL